MSKHILNIFGTFVIGLVFGYGCIFTFDNTKVNPQGGTSISRDMASIHEQDHEIIAKLNSLELLYSYLDIRLQLTDISESDDDVSQIKALITARKDSPAGFKYEWLLHKEMSSTSPLVGELPALKMGEMYEINLSVTGFSKENRSYLSFGINGNLEQNIISKEFLATSRPEDSFEYIVQQRDLQERKEIERKTAGEASKMGSTDETKTFLEKKFSKDKIIK